MMSERVKEKSRSKNPTHLLGMLPQMWCWLKSKRSDIVFFNKGFKASERFPKGIDIYCIHGTADGNQAFSTLIERMSPYLPSSIAAIRLIAFNKRGLGLSIEAFSAQLYEKVKANGSTDIIFMGHSRGGLVASNYAECLKPEEVNVHSIMTICTPFNGTKMAIFPITLFSKSVKEMKVGSEFLLNLNEKLKKSTIPYYQFGVEKDYIVIPTHHAFQPNDKNEEHHTLDKHGHLSILTSWRMVEILLSRILKTCHEVFEGENLSFGKHLFNAIAELKYLMIEHDSGKYGIPDVHKREALVMVHNALCQFDVLLKLSIGEYLDNSLNLIMDNKKTVKETLLENDRGLFALYMKLVQHYAEIAPNGRQFKQVLKLF